MIFAFVEVVHLSQYFAWANGEPILGPSSALHFMASKLSSS
jgi:hypothetical protein